MSALPAAESCQRLQQGLLAWFAVHARPFPWRRGYQPYQVWISEIMLQQTQAERGAVYFQRWLERFPDVRAVAEASEEEVLKLWEGLGYYSRARNIQRAAREMVATWRGGLPDTLAALLALPGIGPYTARAILSLAFQCDYPVVDANVERLFARLFAIDEPVASAQAQGRIWALAEALLPPGRARDWNQALMEFGALVCGRGTPQCQRCPVAAECQSRATGTEGQRPVLATPRAATQVRFVAAVIRLGELYYVRQRPAGGRWAGLWEFPGGQLADGLDPAQALSPLVRESAGLAVTALAPLPTVRHAYTRYRATIHPFLCQLSGAAPNLGDLVLSGAQRWLSLTELRTLAFPAGQRRIVDALTTFPDPLSSR